MVESTGIEDPVVAMAPVDPKMLLKGLNPLLGQNGSIKGIQEAERVAILMKDASKMVSQCVYTNILKATKDEEILKKFVDGGGWDILFKWLSESKNAENEALLMEILKAYQNIPVTTDLLKINACAKTIKSLTKSSFKEELKLLAGGIISSWMKTVRGDASDSTQSTDSKQKKKKLTTNGNSNSSSAIDAKNNDKSHKDRRDSNEKRDPSKVDKLKDKNKSTNNKNSSQGDRPKTVKLVNTKFRSTGLEEDTKLPKIVKKKSTIPTDSSKTVLKRPIASTALKLPEPLEKKPRPVTMLSLPTTTSNSITTTTTAAGGERPGGVKMIAARPKPVILSESTGFMDAIVTAKPLARKRKKPGAPKTPTSPTSPKQPAVPSFYKDTLDTEGENGEDRTGAISPTDKKDETASEAGDQSEVSETSSISDSGGPRKKKKKTVSWAEDSDLQKYHYFELDESERVNVNRVGFGGDMKKAEAMMERKNLEGAKTLARDSMTEQVNWYRPVQLTGAPDLSKGANSKERDIQKERELGVLQAIYFSKDSLPDSSTEPDIEHVSPKEPFIIPLHEANEAVEPEADTVAVEELPALALPQDIANLVASVAQQGTAPQLLSSVIAPLALQANPAMSPPQQRDISTDRLKQILDTFQPPDQPRDGLLGTAPPGFVPLQGFQPPPGMPPHWRGPGGPRGGGRRGFRPHGPRGGGRRAPCKFFLTKGACRDGINCRFLHPGINGPMLS